MSRLASVLTRPDIEIIVVTTSAGRVHTISPAHAAYAKIKKLAISRTDDDALLDYVVGERRAPIVDDTIKELCDLPDYRHVTTNGRDVWILGEKTHDAIASELLFLASCIVADELPDGFEALVNFAEMIQGIDEELAQTLVGLYVKRLVELDHEGQIHARTEGMRVVVCRSDDATATVTVRNIEAVQRRRGEIVFALREPLDQR